MSGTTWPSRTRSGSASRIKEIGRPFQTFSTIGDRVPLEERPEVDVLVPLGDADRQVAQLVRRDVDAARGEAVALLRRERPVVPDDVRDRVGHLSPSADHRTSRTAGRHRLCTVRAAVAAFDRRRA